MPMVTQREADEPDKPYAVACPAPSIPRRIPVRWTSSGRSSVTAAQACQLLGADAMWPAVRTAPHKEVEERLAAKLFHRREEGEEVGAAKSVGSPVEAGCRIEALVVGGVCGRVCPRTKIEQAEEAQGNESAAAARKELAVEEETDEERPDIASAGRHERAQGAHADRVEGRVVGRDKRVGKPRAEEDGQEEKDLRASALSVSVDRLKRT